MHNVYFPFTCCDQRIELSVKTVKIHTVFKKLNLVKAVIDKRILVDVHSSVLGLQLANACKT